MTGNFLELRGVRIKEDANGNICLTDLWLLAGSPASKSTTNWRRLPTTAELAEALADNLRKSLVMPSAATVDAVIYSKPGKGGGTYAHPILALAYAEYLSPDLAIEVKDTYLRLRSGDLSLFGEVAAKVDAAREFQDNRDVSKLIRDKYESVVATHGGNIGHCTNAIYKVLLGGTKREIVVQRNLPKNVLFRDKLPLGELLQTMSTEFMAGERIEDLDVRGKEPCAEASRRSAKIVKEAFERERKDRRDPEPKL